jgi:hypothetical protein
MTEQKKSLVLLLIVLIIVTIGGMIYNTNKKSDLYQNLQYTKGIVVDFSFNNNSYILKYEYEVDGITYTNKESTDYFKCNDGVPGCMGKEFTIRYSSKNPKNSIIDLGKYNSKKPIKPSF